MRFLGTTVLLLVCLWFSSEALCANSRWEELDRNVDELYKQEKYSEALQVARQAVEEAAKYWSPVDGNGEFHAALSKYGELLQAWGKPAEAEIVFREALGVAEGREEPDPKLVTKSLKNLAEFHEAQRRLPEAEAYYALHSAGGDSQKAIENIKQRIADLEMSQERAPELVAQLSALATIYQRYMCGDSAGSEFERPLARAELAGVDDVELAACMEKIGRAYMCVAKTVDVQRAEPLFKRSLDLRERNLGPDSLEVAHSLDGLAKVCDRRDRRSESKSMLKRSLRIKEKLLGKDHPDLSETLERLAGLYALERNYATAACCYKRSSEIRGRVLSGFSGSMAAENAARMFIAAKQYAQAEPLLERSLAQMPEWGSKWAEEGFMGPGCQLIGVYEAQGKHGQTEALLNRWVDLRTQMTDPDHPYLVGALAWLGEFYKNRGRYTEAEPILRKCLTLLAQSGRRPENQEISEYQILVTLGELYEKQCRLDEAVDVYKQCVPSSDKDADSHANVRFACFNDLARVYVMQGKNTEAEALYKRSLKVWEERRKNYEAPSALAPLAELYSKEKRRAEAEELYTRYGKLIERAIGPNSYAMSDWVHAFADLYASWGMNRKAEPLYLRHLSMIHGPAGTEGPHVLDTMRELSVFYRKMGEENKAARLLKRVAAKEKKLAQEREELCCIEAELTPLPHERAK